MKHIQPHQRNNWFDKNGDATRTTFESESIARNRETI
jgi:hypothetical protein